MSDYSLVKAPCFLTGSPRSGTTLLRLMLSHHPKIAWSSEFNYTVRFVGDDGTWPDLEVYKKWLETNLMYRRKEYIIDPSLNYLELVNSFLCQERDQDNKEIVGATVHEFFQRLPLLWPDARFIHIIRDPRDVALSAINMGWAGNVWTGLDVWLNSENLWQQFKPTLSSEQYLEVKYEDLIENSVETLTKICNFLGTDFSEEMLSYPEDTTYSLPDPQLTNQWKKKLSNRQIQLIEARLGEQLLNSGYQPSGLEPIQVSQLEQRFFKVQSILYVKQLNLRRYGLGLTLSLFLAKRLKIKSWEKKSFLEMEKIWLKYVK